MKSFINLITTFATCYALGYLWSLFCEFAGLIEPLNLTGAFLIGMIGGSIIYRWLSKEDTPLPENEDTEELP